MKSKIAGRVWKFGNNVDTDQIIPAEYLVSADNKFLAEHAFEKVRGDFAKKAKKGDIIVAGDNFGCGSSREHAPRALLGLGISAVIAKSFARIFYRNSINLALPLVECTLKFSEGDKAEVDFKKGTVRNISSGRQSKFTPLPEFLSNLMASGGLVPYVQEQLKK